MLRLSKLTDYGTVVLAHIAQDPTAVHTAAEVAEATHVAPPTVSKLLKLLTRGGILVSQRGANGGYALARAPEAISAVDIIDAIEGGFGITECSADHSQCGIESHCDLGGAWQQINLAIRDALKSVTLKQLARPSLLATPNVKLGSHVIPVRVESTDH